MLDGEGGGEREDKWKTQFFDAVIMATGFETEDFFGGRLASLGLEVEDLATNFSGYRFEVYQIVFSLSDQILLRKEPPSPTSSRFRLVRYLN